MTANATAIVIEIIGVAGLVFVAILQLRAEKERKRRKKEEDQRDKQILERQHDDFEMSVQKGRVMSTAGELAYVTSIAVTGGKTNGNVEQAQKEFREAREQYEGLERELARKYLQNRVER